MHDNNSYDVGDKVKVTVHDLSCWDGRLHWSIRTANHLTLNFELVIKFRRHLDSDWDFPSRDVHRYL